MSFTSTQWTFLVVLELLVKIIFVAFFGLLFTLGAAPVIVFVFAAVLFSMLHGVCLLLGSTLVRVLKLIHYEPSSAMKSVVTVVLANALFIGIWMGFASLPMHKGEIGPSALGNLIVASVFAAANITPIFIVTCCSRLLKIIRRLRTATQS
jgi:hypothetical protein